MNTINLYRTKYIIVMLILFLLAKNGRANDLEYTSGIIVVLLKPSVEELVNLQRHVDGKKRTGLTSLDQLIVENPIEDIGESSIGHLRNYLKTHNRSNRRNQIRAHANWINPK